MRVRRPDGGDDLFEDAPVDGVLHAYYSDVRDDGRLVVLARVPQAPDVRVAEYSRYGWHRVERVPAHA